MVEGIGIDLVDKYRFKNLLDKFDNKLALKILSNSEYHEYLNVTNKIDYLSRTELESRYLQIFQSSSKKVPKK